MSTTHAINHFHLFCGLGGGAKGFNAGHARVGSLQADFQCIGGVDSDAGAIADFDQLAGCKGTVLDLFDRQQYTDWHGRPPPDGWREATPADLHAAAGHRRPHIVFTSPPCKGFSGLLSESKSRGRKYQALNRLTLRGIWLALEAWADDPPEFFILENVPRIANRGRPLLDQISSLLQHYGYATAETVHDCGQIGGLAQRRKRFLLVARHVEKVPPFLYQPATTPLRAVGDVLGRMPLPMDAAAGPMHRLPRLQWKTWVRLAFVEAGKDWRSLNRLAVVNGVLRDFALLPSSAWHAGILGVLPWNQTSGTVKGKAHSTTGAHSVADPRPGYADNFGQFGVLSIDETARTVTGQKAPGQGPISVADPRCPSTKHNNCFRVVRWDRESNAVTGGTGPTAGGLAVSDPRPNTGFSKYSVAGYGEQARTVIGGSTTGEGAYAVADPRPGLSRDKGDHYLTGGHYGVIPWRQHGNAVTGAGRHDNGFHNVADPRLPAATEQLVAHIIADDGTWHRPFTTLELAALQGLLDPEEHLQLQGESDSDHRMRIGNAVPPPAAQAIAGVMGTALLLSWSGETFVLSNLQVWVRPLVAALQAGKSEALS